MPVSREDKDGMSYCTITNSAGAKLRLISLGATITELVLPSGVDVVLGYKDVNDYRKNPFYIGCSVGRVANRIKGAKFSLNGKTYHVSANAAPNSLHGGSIGFNQANWSVTELGEQSVTMSLVSPNDDQGYPGTVEATVVYRLTEANEVLIEYSARLNSDEKEATIINLTNHTYFNLDGKGTILNHRLTVNSDMYHPLDEDLVPYGALETVKGTPLDFTTPTEVGQRIEEAGGYDINYNMLDNKETHPDHPSLKHFATLQQGSCTMKLYSDQPGVQLYTGNFLDGNQSGPGKDGCQLIKHGGLCLETQAWPNAINISGAEGQVILRPGELYQSNTLWAFS